jgi:PTH1 family peptidyl-tRNA hydrolase
MAGREPVRTGLVVGLGNPGAEYDGTRHNIGFTVVDAVAGRLEIALRERSRFQAALGDGECGGRKVVLAKPLTYMNRSGVAVRSLVDWLKLPVDSVLVVVDDADLQLGRIRLRESGGSGGHNGLRSIIEQLGGREDFPRLRVGIGRIGPAGQDITGHVLARFGGAERSVARQTVQEAADAVMCCIDEGLAAAMNKFNRRTKQTEQDDGDNK